MHIGRMNIERTCKLASVEGIIELAEVDKKCNLGVNFKSNLQIDRHVANLHAKANRTVCIIKHVFSRINIDMFRILFKSLVRPILEYCSSTWSPNTKISARKIEQIQRRASEMAENLRDVSYSERLRIIGMPTLQLRRLTADMIQEH